VQSIRDALALNDTASAERYAHTLKGVASSVGTVLLEDAASELEQALEVENTKEYPQLIATVESRLNEASTAIATYLDAQRSRSTEDAA